MNAKRSPLMTITAAALLMSAAGHLTGNGMAAERTPGRVGDGKRVISIETD